MVRPLEVLHGLGRAVVQSDRLPAVNDYVTAEPDGAGNQADLPIPFVQIDTPTGPVREEDASTAMVRWVFGEEYPEYTQFEPNDPIGRIFEATFSMDVELTVWDLETQHNTINDIQEMGGEVEMALFRYDSQMRADLLPADDGSTIAAVTDVFVGEGRTTADLGTTPTIRGWRQDVSVRFRHRLDTVSEYGPGTPVRNVITPQPDEFYEAPEEEAWDIEYTPPLDAITSDFEIDPV